MLPKSSGDLRIFTGGRILLTSLAFFEPLGVFAAPDTGSVPEILDNHFITIHELLAIGRIEADG